MCSFRRALVGLGVGLALPLTTMSPARAQTSDQDIAWLVAAHQVNLAEIAAGHAAQQQATTGEVRELAALFIEDHTRLDASLTAVAADLQVDLPDAPTAEQRQQLAAVTARTGPAFDTAWIALQQAGHRAALAATEAEIDDGTEPRVVGLAETAAPVIEHHLMQLDAAAARTGAPRQVAGGSGGLVAPGADPRGPWPFVAVATAGAVLLGGGALLVVRARRMA